MTSTQITQFGRRAANQPDDRKGVQIGSVRGYHQQAGYSLRSASASAARARRYRWRRDWRLALAILILGYTGRRSPVSTHLIAA